MDIKKLNEELSKLLEDISLEEYVKEKIKSCSDYEEQEKAKEGFGNPYSSDDTNMYWATYCGNLEEHFPSSREAWEWILSVINKPEYKYEGDSDYDDIWTITNDVANDMKIDSEEWKNAKQTL